MSVAVPLALVIFVGVLLLVLIFGTYHFGVAYLDADSKQRIYRRRFEEVSSRPTYSYAELLEQVLKTAQPIPIKIDDDIRKLVNLAIDPHANYNEASNAAMQACKRLARKG